MVEYPLMLHWLSKIKGYKMRKRKNVMEFSGIENAPTDKVARTELRKVLLYILERDGMSDDGVLCQPLTGTNGVAVPIIGGGTLNEAVQTGIKIRIKWPHLTSVPKTPYELLNWCIDDGSKTLIAKKVSGKDTEPETPIKTDDTCEHSKPLSWKQWAEVFGMSRQALRDIREEENPRYRFRVTRPGARKWTLPIQDLPAEYLVKYRRVAP